jgi:hypothetical protein
MWKITEKGRPTEEKFKKYTEKEIKKRSMKEQKDMWTIFCWSALTSTVFIYNTQQNTQDQWRVWRNDTENFPNAPALQREAQVLYS